MVPADLQGVIERGHADVSRDRPDGQVGSVTGTLVDQIKLRRSDGIRLLATSAAQRSPLLPEVPIFGETGLVGVEGTS